MAFIPGGTGTASSFPDGFTGSPLANVETITATKVLTTADRRTQILTPSGALRIAQMPATALIGEGWSFVCAAGAAFSLQINASNGSTITTLAPGESTWLNALTATPTDAADWALQIPSTVLSNGTVSTPALRFTGGGSDTGIYSPATDQIAISTAGVQRMLVDASGNVAFDTNTLFVDAANNRVGVGTSSPLATLHSGGNLFINQNATDQFLYFSRQGGAFNRRAWIGAVQGTTGNAQDVVIATNLNGADGTEKVRITEAGSVTLGPANQMGLVMEGGALANLSTTIFANCRINSSFDARDLTTQTGAGIRVVSRGTDNLECILFYANQDNDALDADADVIGSATATGAWTLGPSGGAITHNLYGQTILAFNNIAGEELTLDLRALNTNGSTVNQAQIRVVGETSGPASKMTFWTRQGDANLTEKGSISSAGAWTLGATTTDAPHTIQATRTGNGSALDVTNAKTDISTASHVVINCIFGGDSTPTSGHYIRFVNAGDTDAGSISCNGTNAVLYNTSSDSRYKLNQRDITYGLDEVMQLRPVHFEWRDGNQPTDIGLIAQEVKPIISEIVSVPHDETGKWQMDYSKLTPVLVKAIQELKAIVDAQADRIATLEGGN